MNKHTVLLASIVLLGFILRIWHIGSIPPGLNRDEAAIGYTAYSLLQSGRDEYGRFLPLSLESFGDWKLPFYVYADILVLVIFSLTEVSVRIPSVLLGTLTIPGVYFLAKYACEKNADSPSFRLVLNRNDELSDLADSGRARSSLARMTNRYSVIPLFAAVFLAVSPWHIHFSRVASEANMAVFLVCISLALFFKGLSNRIALAGSGALLGLSLFVYHGTHVSSFLLFLLLLWVLQRGREIRRIFWFTAPFVFFAGIILSMTVFGADATKISGLTFFSDMYSSYEHIVLARLEHPDPGGQVTRMIHNKGTYVMQQFIRGYIRSFSPEFLFIHGGSNLQHNIPNAGNAYVWEGILIMIGIYTIFHERFRWRWFLAGWLLLSPVAAAITKDAPHSARMLAVLPLPQILAGIGGWYLLKKTSFAFLLVPVVCIASLGFFDRYYVHFPRIREMSWGGGYRQLVSSVNRRRNEYSEIIMDRPDYSPYIYFLFYNRMDPAYFQKTVERYDPDPEGFHHVRTIDDMVFKKIDWGDDLVVPDRLLVTWAESTPPSATNSAILVDEMFLSGLQTRQGQTYGLQIGDYVHNRLVETIRLKNGTPQFYLIEVKKLDV